jgi:hypothetical protein
MTTTVIPPKVGMAMGTIMSEPRPVEVMTGIKASMVVETVIMAGLIRLVPAVTTASRISAIVDGFCLVKT